MPHMAAVFLTLALDETEPSPDAMVAVFDDDAEDD